MSSTIKYNQNSTNQQVPPFRAIDFFCGAGGMSYGLQKAGLQILAGIDVDEKCRRTYEANVKGAEFLAEDVSSLGASTLMTHLSIQPYDDDLLLVGCSPCQYWSKVNTDKTKSRQSAFLLDEFSRFVSELRPGWVVIENVPGIVNKKGTVLPSFLRMLRSIDYQVAHGLLDLSLYGVPQTRHRFLLVATRLAIEPTLPTSTKSTVRSVRDCLGNDNGFDTVPAGHQDNSWFMHTVSALSEINLLRIRRTPKDGGDRKAWSDDPNLKVAAYEGCASNQFADVYSRMAWDRPAPTITTRFNSFSNGRFGHPEEDRAISLREGATLQTFPKTFRFFGPTQCVAKQIGNAVPPAFAKLLGRYLVKQHNKTKEL